MQSIIKHLENALKYADREEHLKKARREVDTLYKKVIPEQYHLLSLIMERLKIISKRSFNITPILGDPKRTLGPLLKEVIKLKTLERVAFRETK